MARASFSPLPPNRAIDLYNGLIAVRRLQLHPALAETVNAIGVIAIDSELHEFVPSEALNHVASLGLRGELVFPVPAVIRHRPALLGYYRMLLGLSKKEFGNVLGYEHRWTVIVLGSIPAEQIRGETPTSTEIFDAREIMERAGTDWERFRHALWQSVGHAAA